MCSRGAGRGSSGAPTAGRARSAAGQSIGLLSNNMWSKKACDSVNSIPGRTYAQRALTLRVAPGEGSESHRTEEIL